jgi:hypothetical protein
MIFRAFISASAFKTDQNKMSDTAIDDKSAIAPKLELRGEDGLCFSTGLSLPRGFRTKLT